LAEFGEVFDGDLLFDRAVLVKVLKFGEVFWAVEIVKSLGVRWG